MNLHEYQAKSLLKKYGMPVQEGILATNADEAVAAFEQLGGKFAVMKAQVHAGGRGKAGGVRIAKSAEEAAQIARELIGTRLVTYQTEADGQPVYHHPAAFRLRGEKPRRIPLAGQRACA